MSAKPPAAVLPIGLAPIRRPVLAAALVAALACAGSGPPDPSRTADPSHGVQIVEAASVEEFHATASRFYGRIALRRFNTRSTYQDEELRGFFRTETAFADYYADLAQALTDADFERNRPLSLDVTEFTLDAPGRASVHVHLVGEDARPLRSSEVSLHRVDRWERIDGSWWIVPGKL